VSAAWREYITGVSHFAVSAVSGIGLVKLQSQKRKLKKKMLETDELPTEEVHRF
jgi:hypothetical protein